MKQYGQRMREGLTTLLTDSTLDAHYEVNFSVAEGLTLTQNDSEAIKILVNVTKRKNGEDLRSKYYIGFMVCRGASKGLEEQFTIHLPVLLCSGTVRAAKSVHFLLQKFFDCSVNSYQLSQEDLMWFCALQADEKDTRKGMSQAELMFSFPQLSVRNRIRFKVPLNSLKYLWDRYVST
ncbi:hypothetical protein B7P43_G00098 [Cryptotermes secundus]|uniref:Centromere protein L n=1 Tax=Cryptotermes secundus TaxID=105785 RepID=A0A2J7NKE3_9NEOP|nr:centromere protein L [Cryptotermes secundus]PNE09441.1 hypothetical protein B7P43_G00098 [Cryptotermes secundus]